MDTLSQTFSALADPTRRAILARLSQGPATVTELSAPFPISGPAVSKHLRVLERAGLITQGKEAQWRPCRLEPAPLRAVAEWTEAYRKFWEESFDNLDAYLEELRGAPVPTAPQPSHGAPLATAPRPSRSKATASCSGAPDRGKAGKSVRNVVRKGAPR